VSWTIVFAVLCGALLHASWNAVVKSSGDKAADTALVQLMGTLAAWPLLVWLGPPRADCWPFIAASLVLHLGYYIALAGAYEHGELGLTYPIMRGFAPLLVALASTAIIGEAPSAAAWLGILGITLGVAMVGLAHPGQALHHGKALMFAFANAAIIASYTLVDGLGVRASQDALRYVLLLFVLDGLPYPLLVLWQRGDGRKGGRPALLRYARARWPVATVAGVASALSYAIALWAMTQAPVASVAALRETSVLFAVVLGTVMLKERFGVQRALGAAVIVAGVVALRLG
jgi:phosphonate utilization associated putative membrane protein